MIKKPFWKNPHYRERAKLTGNRECEYLIVGGGVLGVSIAYFLNRRGIKDIILIEKDRIASGATGRAAGMFVMDPERLEIPQFIRRFGIRKSLMYWYNQLAALLAIKHIIEKEEVRCEFEVDPYYVIATDEQSMRKIIKQFKARKRLHQRVRLLVDEELKAELGDLRIREVEKVHWGMGVNPLQYTQNLSNVVAKRGVQIYEHTPLIRLRGKMASVPNGTIRARHIIIALDSFSPTRSVRKFITTIGVTRKLARREWRTLGLSQPPMFIDMERRDYHYVRFMRNRRILVGYGGVYQHKNIYRPSLHAPHLRNIRHFLRRILPERPPNIEYAWSGVMGISRPLLPVAQFRQHRALVAGGGTRVFATMMARYAVNRILGRKQHLDELFKR